MGRSIKKGPFVAYHLLKKVEVLNEKGTSEVISGNFNLSGNI